MVPINCNFSAVKRLRRHLKHGFVDVRIIRPPDRLRSSAIVIHCHSCRQVYFESKVSANVAFCSGRSIERAERLLFVRFSSCVSVLVDFYVFLT